MRAREVTRAGHSFAVDGMGEYAVFLKANLRGLGYVG